MTYQLHLKTFDGPFDLLLHLIDKNEIDIYDIPIAQITREYLAYLEAMEQFDLEIASEFVVMAATLLNIKAKMLAPKPVPEEENANGEPYDPRAELVHDLLEYKRFKEIAAIMGEYEEARRQHFVRPNEITLYASLFPPENPLDGKTLADLQQAFSRVWRQAQKRGFVQQITRDEVSVGEMMERILRQLAEKENGIVFEDLFVDLYTKTYLVVAFLALLELVRRGRVLVRQETPYQAIYIFLAA